MGGESCTVLRLRLMRKLAMSHIKNYIWIQKSSTKGNTQLYKKKEKAKTKYIYLPGDKKKIWV